MPILFFRRNRIEILHWPGRGFRLPGRLFRQPEMDLNVLVEEHFHTPVFWNFELQQAHQADRLFITPISQAGNGLGVHYVSLVIDGIFEDDGAFHLFCQRLLRVAQVLSDKGPHGFRPSFVGGFLDKVLVFLHRFWIWLAGYFVYTAIWAIIYGGGIDKIAKKNSRTKLKSYITLRPESLKTSLIMIIVDVRDNESIERALKKYKIKYNRAGIMRELRGRQQYTKPSVRRRNEKLKAIYRQQKQVETE